MEGKGFIVPWNNRWKDIWTIFGSSERAKSTEILKFAKNVVRETKTADKKNWEVIFFINL